MILNFINRRGGVSPPVFYCAGGGGTIGELFEKSSPNTPQKLLGCLNYGYKKGQRVNVSLSFFV